MPVLLESTFDNLLEINFVADEDRLRENPKRSVGLKDLGKILARCPRLRSVSVEDIDIKYADELDDIRAFVDLLDCYPDITYLFLTYHGFPYDENAALKNAPIQEILQQRLARVHSTTIKSLCIRKPEAMTRSQRELPAATGSGGQ